MSFNEELFSIKIQSETFTLTRAQIECDAPNYFTRALLGSFAESGTRSLTFYREPKFFTIIQSHLSGYGVLPIADEWRPSHMAPETALKNLLEDARFYGLERLEKDIEAFLVSPDGKATEIEGAVIHDNQTYHYQNKGDDDLWYGNPIKGSALKRILLHHQTEQGFTPWTGFPWFDCPVKEDHAVVFMYTYTKADKPDTYVVSVRDPAAPPVSESK